MNFIITFIANVSADYFDNDMKKFIIIIIIIIIMAFRAVYPQGGSSPARC